MPSDTRPDRPSAGAWKAAERINGECINVSEMTFNIPLAARIIQDAQEHETGLGELATAVEAGFTWGDIRQHSEAGRKIRAALARVRGDGE